MAYFIRTLAKTVLVCLVFLSLGCSTAAKSFHTSTPAFKIAQTQIFESKIEPQKNDSAFFSTFLLSIENKTDRDIQINWNESYYVHNKKTKSALVYRGIDPAQVKEKTVPNETITANSQFSKTVSPLSKVAFAKFKDRSTIDGGGISAGLLPEGLNTIVLVIEDKDEQIKKFMSVTIKKETE